MTQQDERFGLSEIGQIAVNVRDLETAVAFYRDTLGMAFLYQFSPPGLAFFDCAGVRLMLDAVPEAQHDGPSSIIYYRVADLQGAFETLKARGVSFTEEPQLIAQMEDHDLWMAFFRDPGENTLALMAELPKGT